MNRLPPPICGDGGRRRGAAPLFERAVDYQNHRTTGQDPSGGTIEFAGPPPRWFVNPSSTRSHASSRSQSVPFVGRGSSTVRRMVVALGMLDDLPGYEHRWFHFVVNQDVREAVRAVHGENLGS